MSAKPGLVLFSPFSEILIKYRISEKHEFTIHHSRLTIHSVLKLLTGFADAALNVRIHNIIKAIINMIIPPAINTHTLISVLYAKFYSHLYPPQYAIGTVIINA